MCIWQHTHSRNSSLVCYRNVCLKDESFNNKRLDNWQLPMVFCRASNGFICMLLLQASAWRRFRLWVSSLWLHLYLEATIRLLLETTHLNILLYAVSLTCLGQALSFKLLHCAMSAELCYPDSDKNLNDSLVHFPPWYPCQWLSCAGWWSWDICLTNKIWKDATGVAIGLGKTPLFRCMYVTALKLTKSLKNGSKSPERTRMLKCLSSNHW